MGPTASGKSNIAIEIARHFPVEIISVDSAQVYREMDIGSAKPDKETQAAIPHHLIDLIDPDQHYSAARFREGVGIYCIHADCRKKTFSLAIVACCEC